jgi:hypothetical protein
MEGTISVESARKCEKCENSFSQVKYSAQAGAYIKTITTSEGANWDGLLNV